LAAFRAPDLLFQLVAGGALASAFIPTFAAYWTRSDPAGAWLLFSRVLNLVTLVLALIAAAAAMFALPLVRTIIAPGFEPAQQALAAHLMRWMLLSTVLFGASGLTMGALNVTQQFLLPAAAPVFYNLAIIGGAWFLAPQMGIEGLAVGAVVGALVHLLVQTPGLRRAGLIYKPSFSWHDTGVREVLRLMGPRVLGLFFVQMHFLINTVLASSLAAGSLAALNYAWLLMLLPQGIFAQSVATATFPTLAAQVAAGQLAAMRHTLGQALRMVLFLTMPAAVVLFGLSNDLVAVLFERASFGAQSTRMVAHALQWYACGLIAHAALEIVVRAFYALHDTLTPVLIGVGAMTLNILLSLWWVRTLGYGGLALANSAATSIEVAMLLWLLWRKMRGFEWHLLLRSAVRQTVAALLMGAALWGWQRMIDRPAWVAFSSLDVSWLAAGGGLLIGGTVYIAASLLLRSDELHPAVMLITRRLPGRRGR
jgi:putative peptidoglycan lipid II flippase